MDRDEAAAWIGERYGAYLSAASRTATDDAANLGPALDDALRALGYAAVDIPTADPEGDEAEDRFKLQLSYRTMLQVDRDLGATSFDISTGGDSFRLSQLKAAAKEEVARLKDEVLAEFGTTGVVPTGDSGAVWSIDLNFLADPCELETA